MAARWSASPFELVPGRYTVILNNTRQLVSVVPGTRIDLRAGAVALAGDTESYWIADATGQRALTGSRAAGSPMELLAGSYVVHAGARQVAVQILGGRTSRVTP